MKTPNQILDGKDQNMLRHERLQLIRAELQHNGQVSVNELSQRFGVSEYTIRRDLTELENEGLLQRTYGGAIAHTPIQLAMRRWSEDEELRYRTDLLIEYQERFAAGHDVSSVADQMEKIDDLSLEQVEAIWAAMEKLPLRHDYPYDEPSTLIDICEKRPEGPRQLPAFITVAELEDRLHAAWLGRCAGCLLGMPVEAIGRQRDALVNYLTLANAYPPDNYISEVVPIPAGYQLIGVKKGTVRERINGMPHDDDTMYTLLALHVLEEHGFNFDTYDVASEWLDHLAYHHVFTAERVAYRNLVLGLQPPETPRFRNAYREFIGAQIRADMWGYVSIGWPEQAAEFAFRDASLSHTMNGLYGAMFVAAMLATAYTTDDLDKIILTGLSEIPRGSRLAEAIHQVLDWSHQDESWEATIDRIWDTYGSYDPIHVINNAAVVTAALIHGRSDFSRSIGIAVAGGFDTDCNGATVGSIIGLMRGTAAIPAKWTHPLNDTIRFSMAGFEDTRISALAQRTAALARQCLERCAGRPRGG